MAQPSVASYFNTRKRCAVDDLNLKLLKKAAIDLDNKIVQVNVIIPDEAKQHTDEPRSYGKEQPATVAEILQQNKLHLARKIQEKSASKKAVAKKTSSRIRKSKESDNQQQNIQSIFINIQQNAILKMPLQDITEVEQDIVEIEHRTPPSSPVKNVNALDKIVGKESGLSLNELRLKMCRSNRLAELKTSMNRLKTFQAKLDKIEEKTSKIAYSPVLKTFKTIELEVHLSPQKLQSPEKSYLSPRKDSSARKNLLNLLSPTTKNAVSITAQQSVSKQLFQSAVKLSLPLPYKYRCVAEMFRCIDTVCQIMYNRKETIIFRRLKPAVEEMIKRNVYEKHLGQILMIYPEAFQLKREKMRVFGTGAKTEQWELVITPISQSSMTADVVIERRRIFSSILTDRVKEYHNEYLVSLEPPITVDRNKITRWHPEFDIERVPDIEVVALPQEPTEEQFATGKQVLKRAKEMFKCNTRMEQAMKRLQEKQAASGDAPPAVPVKTHADSFLKGIPPAILEKVRQRQAANALESMTRSDSKEKELQLYGRLPDLCRLTRNLFVTEKKSVLPLEVVLNKLENSMRTYLTRKDLEGHLRVTAKEFPKWLVFHEIRGAVFVKICKATDLTIIISKLETILKDKTNS